MEFCVTDQGCWERRCRRKGPSKLCCVVPTHSLPRSIWIRVARTSPIRKQPDQVRTWIFLPEGGGRGCGLAGPVTPLPPSWAQRMAQKRVLW